MLPERALELRRPAGLLALGAWPREPAVALPSLVPRAAAGGGTPDPDLDAPAYETPGGEGTPHRIGSQSMPSVTASC